ncbi:ATP-binding cassette domain-containing protein [Acidisoma cladoniae]|jgi:simple sugar transport system ATP-binding protein|uniref:ATP-binding cassette domain-containing protein n=1 Tax=Acidisoma cladoniae TaxID=3040935 RepID=UPI00254A0CEA|nr:ATP-binding cassette domain-containing protein [Acidisoma sp. PAMC 29798]
MTPNAPLKPAGDVLLSLQHITRTFGSVTALHDVTFDVRAGEVVGLVGDNGAGKSTIIKIISGMFQQTSGEVILEGTPHRWTSPQQALGAGIETVYQDVGLASTLSITANIFLGREIVRPGLLGRLGFLDNVAMTRVAKEDTAKTGIRLPHLETTVGHLSGGQRQAITIARSMSWARKLLILDEPTNHLGVHEVEELLRLIRHVRDEGVAVILISHTLAHVMAITDRIVVMRLGEVVAEHVTRTTTTSAVVNDIVGATEAEIARNIN